MEQKNKFTVLHRLLHWVMFIAMSVLFITGFLRMNWMNKKHIIKVVQENTQGMEISKDQLRSIAKTIHDPMFEWHELFAHVMIISFVIRIIYMIAKGIKFPNPFKKNIALKERLQGLTYVYFYLFVTISAVTGIFIEKDILSQYHSTVEGIHKWGIYWFPIFIVLHIAGILVAEFTNKKGIVSKMISG